MGLGLKHLQNLLELQSLNTVIPHAGRCERFRKWTKNLPARFVEDTTSKLASLTQYLGLMNPEDHPAKRTVIKTHIQRIKWAQDVLELYDPLPTQPNQIQKLTAAHFKKMGASAALPTDGFLYEGHHILQMIEAIATRTVVFV